MGAGPRPMQPCPTLTGESDVSRIEEEEYGYKVDLEEFSGPLDLLLYLIRQDEVDITHISIARITDQYLAHLELLQLINVNLAGEFLLMAATLMEIKSRMLLPRPEEAEEEEEDPRADLIRQLIEYKKFKDAARQLSDRGALQALKYLRGAGAALGLPAREPEDELPILIGELSVWDLVAAFKTIVQQTSLLDVTKSVVLDDRPLTVYCNALLDRLRGRATATFRELFEGATDRMALISTFLALLELMKRRRLRAEQGASPGDIRILVLDATPVTAADFIEEDAAQPPAEPVAPEPVEEPEVADEAFPSPAVEAPAAEDLEPAHGPFGQMQRLAASGVTIRETVVADGADEAAPSLPEKARRATRPVEGLRERPTKDEDLGVDHIDVPDLKLAPDPPPQAPILPAPRPSRRRRRPPSPLSLLTRRRRRRHQPVAVVPKRH